MLIVAITVAFSIGALISASPGQAQTTGCSYPFDNCSTTSTVAPPSTTPGNTTTSTTTGGTTTTSPSQGGGDLVIVISIDRSTVKVVVRVRVCNATTGALVTITFNGIPVASSTANQSIVCSSQFALPAGGRSSGVLAAMGPLGRLIASGSEQAQAAPNSGVETTFTVPDVPPGAYLVCAQSPGKNVACTNYTVLDSASVLGTSFSGGAGAAPLVSASNPNSFLAFTGMGLLRLLLLAAVLIAVGWYMVRRNQHGRRHHRSARSA
ncbi:MAG TPA: hypothetical protein VG076_07925 [Acidimicrobiales bacterium]|nr:hypothetical protein [Acidimicrobiales bacterium]